MADKKINLDFYAKVQTDVESVKGVVKNLKAQLEDLKLPAGATKNFEKSFEKLEGQIRDFESLASNGVNSLADTKKVQAAWDKITKSINGLGFSLKELDAINDQIFPKEVSENIKKANRALEEYQSKLKEIKDTEKYKAKKAQISEAEKEVTRTRSNYSNEKTKLANKKDEVTRLEGAWASRVEEYTKQADKVKKLNEEYQNLSNTLDEMRVNKAKLESVGAIDSTGKVSSKYKGLLNEKESELADLEDEAKLKEKTQEKQLEFENRIKKAQDRLNKATQYEKQSKTEEKKTKWVKEQAEAQAELNAAQKDSQDFTSSIEARKEALREEIKLMKEQLALAEQVTQNRINEQSKKTSEKKAELENERKNETFKEDEKLKKSLDTASAQLRNLEITSQSAKNALDAAEKTVEDLNNELNNIETDNAKNEWQEVVNTLKQFTDVNLDETKGDIEAVKKILEDYTADEIKKTPEILEKLRQAASGAEKPIRDVGKAADDAAEEFREMDRAARDMENLKDQVLDFFSISNAIQIFKDAIRSAFETVKELDAAMTETAVVTDFSVGDMWEKLPQYADEASRLGTSIKSLYEATTLYYQQGLNSAQAMDVGVETMKMARIAGMDAAAATEAMTAALRGFNMEINEMSATRINDVYSELAAITAADTSQIATAMSKTASIAASANMEFETTAALLAQIIETTQEAPETAGTAMKTIIARFTEVKQLFDEGMLSGKDLEGEEIDINKIDTALKKVGISLSDFLRGEKGIDDIFLELASKWDTLDLATQRYIATTAAGSRQQSRFLAMMSNYGRTMELVSAANNSAGASQKQFDKTLESLDAKLQRLKNAWDTFAMGLANNDLIKLGVDLLTKLLETINDLTDDLGGAVGGFAKLAIAIGGLKVGKGLFNSVFDVKPLTDKLGKVTGVSNVFAKALNKLGVEVKNSVYENIEAANASVNKFTTGMTVAGAACGVFAQYVRNLGLEELATGLEIAGTALITLSGGINMLNSLAAAMGTTISGLFSAIGTAISGAFGAVVAFLAPIWPLALAIAAAIGVVVAGLIKLYKNSPVGQLKAAQKASEEAAEAAQEAADAYNNLNSALDGISSRTASLDNMARGTQEWRDAVTELNKEMLSLVEQYPELAGYLTNEGGVLKIDYDKKMTNKYGEEQTAQEVINSYQQRSVDIQQKSYQKQIEEKEAEIKYEQSKVKKAAGQWYLTDYNKAMKESATGFVYEDQLLVFDELAKAIANGEVQNDQNQIQEWLRTQASNKNFQINDWSNFDYNAIQEYGNYLLGSQAAIEGLTDAAIAAQVVMTDFSGVSTEAQQMALNLNSDILRTSYENTKAKNEKEKSEITEEDRDAYARAMGYTKTKNWLGQTKYEDSEGTKVKIDDSDVSKFIATTKADESVEDTLTTLAKHFDASTEDQQKLMGEIFTEGAKDLSFATLAKFGEYQNGDFGLSSNEDRRNDLAVSMGFDSFQAMADTLKVAPEQLATEINEVFAIGGTELVKSRKNLVKNMSKYSSNVMKDFQANSDILNMLELKYQEFDISGILTDVISQLDKTGDEEFSTAAFESLRDLMLKANGAAEMEDALNFFNEIDFSNPIEALDKINNEIKNGTGLSKELAISMKEANGSFLGFSSQLSSLVTSEGFEDIKSDLDEIIEKNGEISAMDVFDLTKSYKTLDKVLKNNEITAMGLARVLEGIADGTLQVEHLTDAVLASLSSFESLQSIAAKTVKFFEDFDLGIDESVVGDTVVGWGDKIIENMEKGAVGNSQNFRILDTLFPGWSEDLEGDALVKKMTELGKLLQGNGQNLRKMWSDLADGKDYQGGKVSFETATDEKFSNMSVDDTGKEILLSGWEGKNLTSADLVTWISDAYNVSAELGAAMLTDFKNNSSELAAELRENDYTAGIKDAYDALRQYGDIKLVDEQEIKTIAKLLGEDEGKVRDSLVKEYGAKETHFYDEKGQIKSYDYISNFMDTQVSGAEAGQKWSQSFFQTISESDDLVDVLNLSELDKELGKLGISGINAEKIRQQAFESIRDGISDGTGAGVAKITETLENGQEIEIPIRPDMSYEEYKQQLVDATQEAQNAALASAIGESVATAMNNIEVASSITENSIIEIKTSIEGAVQGANTDVNPSISEESAAALTSQVEAAIPSEKTVTVNYRQGSYGLPYINPTKTVTVNYKVGFSFLGDTGVDEEHADGIKKAPYKHNALVSEEGPELIQTEDGAYLTGQNGPEFVHINKGDTVYTAQETEEILKPRSHSLFPRFAGGSASGYGNGSAYNGNKGGSGGKSSDDDEETWENPFDKLYNLLRKIDEELHQRERLERRYEKLLEDIGVSANKIVAVSREELAHLEQERKLQEYKISGRNYQIDEYQKENSDLQKYARFVENDRGERVLRIDWDLINKVTDTEKGERIEEYVSQLEEWDDDLQEAEEALWDIEDAVAEIKERGKDQYEELEDKIKEAIVQSYQDQIDKLSNINDSINDTNAELLDAIQTSIDKQRQDRDNQRTEDELAEKQRRLLYLQQDTSGANALEILRLQDEIEQGREDYTDTLIDQKISELQRQNDEASKQREKQITLLQAQLDHYIESGAVWDEVYSLMESGLDENNGLIRGSRLEQILKNADNFSSLSVIGQQEWWKEFNAMVAEALAYLELGRQLEDLGVSNQEVEIVLPDGSVIKGTVDDQGNVTGENGQTYNNVYQGADGRYYAGENIEEPKDPVVEHPNDGDGGGGASAPQEETPKYPNWTDDNVIGIAEAIVYGSVSGWGKGQTRWDRLDAKIGPGASTVIQQRVNDIIYGRVKAGQASKHRTEYYYNKFEHGGLADFTGPAWLDGSKSRPEIVLNPQDSRNFIQLRDILSSVLNRGNVNTATENNGDILYDIDINVESIGSDYDVEQVANKVKSLINEDARYRNNNTVSLKR